MRKSRDEFWQLSTEEKRIVQSEMLHGSAEVDVGVHLKK